MLRAFFDKFKQRFKAFVSAKPFWLSLGAVTLLNLSGCTQVLKGVEPVENFELARYLGEWHEIARLDHRFEKGLSDVTATYSMREDGGVRVLNSGFNAETQAVKNAEGKAYFVGAENIGRLKVSFFGPFYGGYNIAKLDSDYQMALIIGPNTDYAWILARQKQPGLVMCNDYLKAAEALGIPQERWIMDAPCR